MLGRAHAEPLLVSIEGQGAVAVTTPQSDQFGPGFNAAISVRYPLGPMLQVGAEARAGLLSAGEEAFALGQEEPRPGSYELGMLMVRLKPLATFDGTSPRRAAGLFIDLGAGGGVTGKEARVGFQGGVGFGFGLGGGITLAPTVRYLQVIQPADPLSSRDARLMLFGLELSAFDARARVHHKVPESVVVKAEPPPPAAVVPEPPAPPEVMPPAPPEPEPELDRDHDQILDANDQCPDEPEVVNGKDDEDGCPDEGLIALENDRIVLDARVLFDAGYARVKHAAWAALDAIAKLKQQHPEWVKIRIEGHADARGSAKLNQSLSERRARNAMKHLIKIGVPADQLEAIGYGSSRPRDSGTGDEANQRNRRVEFVVVRGDAPEQTEAPKPPPAPPKHESVVLPEFTVEAPAKVAPPSAAPAKPPEPVPPTAAPPKPLTPANAVDAGAPNPPPTKSGLTPSGLRPIPAERK